MYDANVFAVLTAHDKLNLASSAFHLPANKKWLRKGNVAEVPSLSSPEATPAEDQQSETERSSAIDRLVITFDVKNYLHGVQFGRDPLPSDVLLGPPMAVWISRKQYNIIVDSDLRICLQDPHSTRGTAVGCGGQNRTEWRKRETWILAHPPGNGNPFKDITIHSDKMIVKIEFPNHAAASAQYVENLRAFSKKHQEALAKSEKETIFIGFGLDCDLILPGPKNAQSPGDRLVYYDDKRIGQGTFGTVMGVIRMRDGKYFAAKTFEPPPFKERLNGVALSWFTELRREFTIMKDNSHPNLMRIFDFQETPWPRLIMDYYPEGNIVDAGVHDEENLVSAFGQILDALRHLHAKGLTHRNLKPTNILVETRPLFKVVITDLGLAQALTSTTILGDFYDSLIYRAPEAFPDSSGHGTKADMWSLGVVILDIMNMLPVAPFQYEMDRVASDIGDEYSEPVGFLQPWMDRWFLRLHQKLADEEDGSSVEILRGMMQDDVKNRWAADTCLRRGFENGLFKRRLADGLVVCATDQNDFVRAIKVDERTMMLTEASPRVAEQSPESPWTSFSSETTEILGGP